MTFSYKYIGLTIGILIYFISFLFFGRKQETYQILLLIGLVTSAIFYLIILCSKGSLITKLLWTVYVLISISLQQFAEPILIDSSYRIYLKQTNNTLADINSILMQKTGAVTVFADTIFIENDILSTEEKLQLRKGREKLGVYQIAKSDNKVYYGLWGFLDVRLGITFLSNPTISNNQYRHITGNWYR